MQAVSDNFKELIESGVYRPVNRVKVYPTTKTVPSLGFKAAFYNAVGVPTWNNSDLLFPASSDDLDNIIEPSTVIAFDFGIGGSPDVVNKSHSFAVKWSGFFFARYSGAYRFYMDCAKHNRLRIKFNGSYLTRKAVSDDSVIDNWSLSSNGINQELYSDTGSLTKGNWYPIEIEYWVPAIKVPQSESNFLCVKYYEPYGATTNLNEWGNSGGNIVTDYQSDNAIKVLSAGVVNCTTPAGVRTNVDQNNVGFLTGNELTQIQAITGQRGTGEAAQYQISVPVPNANQLAQDVAIGAKTIKMDSAEGFPREGVAIIGDDAFHYRGRTNYNLLDIRQEGSLSIQSAHSTDDVVSIAGAGDYPYNPTDKSYGILKLLNLCTVEAGYRDNSDVDHIAHCVTGFIYPNPVLTRDEESDVLQFFVTDFKSDLVEKFFVNYPNQASYAGARYYKDHLLYEPDGIDRPVAYDRWNVVYAVRDILMKANIDPVLLYARERKNITGGANFIKDYGDYLIGWNENRLDSRTKYGRPMEVNVENADDAYNWLFGHSDKFLDGLSEIALNYLYRFDFQPDGKPCFGPQNTPSEFYNDDGVNEGGIDYYIPPPIKVTYPNSVVELSRGDNCIITWNGDNIGNVKLELYIAYYEDFGEWSKTWYKHPKYGTIVASTADDGSYTYQIPSDIGYMGGRRGAFMPHHFKVKVIDLSNADNYDFTDQYFTIKDV